MQDFTPGDIRFSPQDIAEALGEHPPTEQQAEVIASPLTPRLVVAGAGSGKTTTMSDRVTWLVANGLVRPEEILGVTFTRKAAGELSQRIAKKLRMLRSTGLLTEPEEDEDAPGAVQEPTVSTYHSYANSLVRSYGLRLGIESDTVLLGRPRPGSWRATSCAAGTVPCPSRFPPWTP